MSFSFWQGASNVSWVAIDDDGNLIEVKPPTPSPPASSVAPLPDLTTASTGSDVYAHPRVLRVTEAHRGCSFKFRVQPVRSDGNEGHMESSRPTGDVPKKV